jgi:hypothetical protein
MPCVGFEPMIPAFERAKIVHASDRSPTKTGTRHLKFDVYLELHIFGALVNYRNLLQIYVTQRTNVMIMDCDLCR